MIRKHISDVEGQPVTSPGFSGMTARFVLTRNDGCPTYALRIMEFLPGGHTSFHRHKEEHEIYIIEGEGTCLDGEKREHALKEGDTLFIGPCEYHQVKNTGTGLLRMLCTVPLLPGKDGTATTPCPDQ